MIRIGRARIGEGAPCFVIAEAGVNHNGSVARALKLVDAAKTVGADCVKFQTFRSEEIAVASAPKAAYQKKQTNPKESQRVMLKKLELSADDFKTINAYCNQRGILFLSTPYSVGDVDLLEGLNVLAYKVASGQIIEPAFLRYIALKKKPMIVSTGMATLAEVLAAARTIRSAGLTQCILLQCTTNYPSDIADANLRVMDTLRTECRLPIGYSDHTTDSFAAWAAVARGACVIEKHLTLDKSLAGPDHAASSNPKEFAKLVAGIRRIEKSLGRSEKTPSIAERQNAKTMRRSVASARWISQGNAVQREDLTFKRPAAGIPPRDLDAVVGSVARRNIPPDTLISYSMIQRKRHAGTA